MFEIGDFVVKANHGICKVENIGCIDITKENKDRKYFFLSPMGEVNSKLYVPIDKADTSLRKVVTAEEAWSIIEQIPDVEEAWIADDRQREQKYKEAIQSCELEKLISIIKNMYHRREKRTAQGKKNTSVDEYFFKVAENNLYTELAFAIGREKEEMRQIIAEKIESMGDKK